MLEEIEYSEFAGLGTVVYQLAEVIDFGSLGKHDRRQIDIFVGKSTRKANNHLPAPN